MVKGWRARVLATARRKVAMLLNRASLLRSARLTVKK
jgi:hypothetical protein